MRTDVKVGLVCLLVLVMGLVAYFALQGNHPREGKANPSVTGDVVKMPPAGPVAPPAGTADAAAVSPPVALASDTPGVISPPSSATTGPATGSPLYPPAGSTRPSLLPSIGSGTASAPALSTGGGLGAPGGGYSPSGPGSPSMTSGGLSSGGTPTGPGLGGSSLGGSSLGGSSLGGSSLGGSSLRPGEAEPTRRAHDSLLDSGTSHTGSLFGDTGSGIGAAGGSSAIGGSGTYAIQKGDTLSAIAKKNHITVAALKAANPTINPDRLKIKQVINLPAPGSSAATPGATASSGLTGSHSAATRPATTRSSHSGAPRTPAATTIGATYKVKKGDTLRKIAKAAYGDESQWRRILRANRGDLASANDLETGMVLRIPR